MSKNVETGFDPHAGKYAFRDRSVDPRFHHEYYDECSFLSDTYVEEILSKIQPKQNGLYLDIGGGMGEVAQAISNLYGGQTIVTDIASAGLKISKVENNAIANATSQPFADETFDLVHSKDVMVHIENKDLFLREVYRLLKPGGLAVITTEENESGSLIIYYGKSGGQYAHIPILTLQDFEQIRHKLQHGESDNLIPGVRVAKMKNNIPQDAKAISLSPPYFPVIISQLIETATKLGFKIRSEDLYQPKWFDEDWYFVTRRVLTLEK